METDVNNSCLMLAVKLDTPVNLGCVFDSEDLKDTGIELDSHITLLYAQGKELPRYDLMNDVKTILGEQTIEFMDLLKEEHDYNLLDYFHIDSFENDSDYFTPHSPINTFYQYLQSKVVIGAPGLIEPSSTSSFAGGTSSSGAIS